MKKSELNQLILATGVTKTCATRRANEALKHGKYMERALIWGLKTFGDCAPTRVTQIDESKPFKSIAHYAYMKGFPAKG